MINRSSHPQVSVSISPPITAIRGFESSQPHHSSHSRLSSGLRSPITHIDLSPTSPISHHGRRRLVQPDNLGRALLLPDHVCAVSRSTTVPLKQSTTPLEAESRSEGPNLPCGQGGVDALTRECAVGFVPAGSDPQQASRVGGRGWCVPGRREWPPRWISV